MDPMALHYRSPTKRVVLGHLNNQNGSISPISPMANLKLLTKVATSQFSMEENNIDYIFKSEDHSQIKSRKFRSLSFICEKFLLLYPLDIKCGECKHISLGYLASVLEIEKRRVYDIINVVASLQMAIKVCKDKYKWYGRQNLLEFLTKLKIYALQNKMDYQVQELLKIRSNERIIEDHCYSNYEVSRISSYSDKLDDNRIGILCQKFIMMFLVIEEEGTLNLAGIAKLILSDEQGKTGMRRLYDVANILETLGLIKRHGKIHKKPCFVYCGPKIDLAKTDLTSEPMPVIQNVDFCDTSSESSLDVAPRKIDSMLEVVCTELEKFDDGPKAKRKLCLSSDSITLPDSATFIKAPSQSFRFSCNQIIEKSFISCDDSNVKSVFHPEFTGNEEQSEKKMSKGADSKEIVITKSQEPIKIIKPRSKLNIQNGEIYRAVKNGNFVKLVKLEFVPHTILPH